MKTKVPFILVCVCLFILLISTFWVRSAHLKSAADYNFTHLEKNAFYLTFFFIFCVIGYTLLLSVFEVNKWSFFMCIVVGLLIRGLLLNQSPLWHSDLWRGEMYGEVFWKGYNPYVATPNGLDGLVNSGKLNGVPIMTEWGEHPFIYPALTFWFFAILCRIFPGYGYAQVVFLKGCFVALDLGCAYLIYKLSRHLGADPKLALTLYLLNPISLVFIGLEGQYETLPLFFALLGIYFFLRSRKTRISVNTVNVSFSGISLALGTLGKYFPATMFPAGLIKMKGNKAKAIFILTFSISSFLFSIPFILNSSYILGAARYFSQGGQKQNLANPYIALVIYRPHISAWKGPSFLSMYRLFVDRVWCLLTLSFMFTNIWLLLRNAKNGDDSDHFFAGSVTLLLAFMIFLGMFQPWYALWLFSVVPFIRGRVELRKAFWIMPIVLSLMPGRFSPLFLTSIIKLAIFAVIVTSFYSKIAVNTWSRFHGNVVPLESSDVDTKLYYIKVERYDWVEVTDHFKGVESFFHRNRERVFLKTLRDYNVSSPFLDVGCGTGLILRHLPRDAVGLDINPWNLRKAKKHAPQAQLVVGDAENMPIRDDVFRTIICTETLEHLPAPREAVREIHRVLRPKGKFFGSVPHKNFLWNFRFLSSTCPREEPFHNQSPINDLEHLLSRFRIAKVWLSTLRLNANFVCERTGKSHALPASSLAAAPKRFSKNSRHPE